MAKDTFFCKTRSLNLQGKLQEISRPMVMGILNATPDSFYDKSRIENDKDLISKASQMLKDGADILDIGAVSTRPGAEEVHEQEEFNRLIPKVKMLRNEFPDAILSVDTYRAGIAALAVDAGANIINDISGGQYDPFMFETIAELNVPYILMHVRGKPENMQDAPEYEDIVTEVLEYFAKRVFELKTLGVNNILLDPGFGFGKTLVHNFEILAKLDSFRILEYPMVLGFSRKSMIQKTLGLKTRDSLNGTTALNVMGMMQGGDILRVHDVKEAMQAVRLYEAMAKQKNKGNS